jgi:transcription antitermination factor NusG
MSLRGKGYEEWLPLYQAKRRWSDREKQISLPLFPGYLFCRLDVQDRLLPILTTPGVIGIVSAGKVPIPVSDDEIAVVQAIIRSGLSAQPWPSLTTGSKVLVERGPLVGIEGFVVSVRKTYRLVVSVQLLQRAVAVDIDREWVRPVASPRTAAFSEDRRISKEVA